MAKVLVDISENKKKELLEEWSWFKLGDICEFVGGSQPPKSTFSYESKPGYIRLVQIQDFRKDDSAVYIPLEMARRTFETDDVMIGRYGPPVFQILRGLSGAYNVALMKAVPKGKLTKDFLYFLLQEPSIQSAVISNSQRAAGQTGIQKHFLENILVPIPSLKIQDRLVQILSDRMDAIAKARAATEEQLEAAKALPAAYLRQIFKSPEAQKWKMKLLGDVVNLLPAKSISLSGDTEVIAVTTACLSEIGFQKSGLKDAKMHAKDVEKSLISSGEILIARSNTPELVGRVSLYPGSQTQIVASDLVIRIQSKSELDPKFLTGYLSFLYLSGYWKERAGGASSSMKKITRSQLLETIEVPVPDKLAQAKISALIEETMSQIQDCIKRLASQLEHIQALPSSILRQAFNGEL